MGRISYDSMGEAAKAVGMHESTLHRKLRFNSGEFMHKGIRIANTMPHDSPLLSEERPKKNYYKQPLLRYDYGDEPNNRGIPAQWR